MQYESEAYWEDTVGGLSHHSYVSTSPQNSSHGNLPETITRSSTTLGSGSERQLIVATSRPPVACIASTASDGIYIGVEFAGVIAGAKNRRGSILEAT